MCTLRSLCALTTTLSSTTTTEWTDVIFSPRLIIDVTFQRHLPLQVWRACRHGNPSSFKVSLINKPSSNKNKNGTRQYIYWRDGCIPADLFFLPPCGLLLCLAWFSLVFMYLCSLSFDDKRWIGYTIAPIRYAMKVGVVIAVDKSPHWLGRGWNKKIRARSFFLCIFVRQIFDRLFNWDHRDFLIPMGRWRHSEYLRYESLEIIGLSQKRTRMRQQPQTTTKRKKCRTVAQFKTKHV